MIQISSNFIPEILKSAGRWAVFIISLIWLELVLHIFIEKLPGLIKHRAKKLKKS